jgi:hypothetical protein
MLVLGESVVSPQQQQQQQQQHDAPPQLNTSSLAFTAVANDSASNEGII